MKMRGAQFISNIEAAAGILPAGDDLRELVLSETSEPYPNVVRTVFLLTRDVAQAVQRLEEEEGTMLFSGLGGRGLNYNTLIGTVSELTRQLIGLHRAISITKAGKVDWRPIYELWRRANDAMLRHLGEAKNESSGILEVGGRPNWPEGTPKVVPNLPSVENFDPLRP